MEALASPTARDVMHWSIRSRAALRGTGSAGRGGGREPNPIRGRSSAPAPRAGEGQVVRVQVEPDRVADIDGPALDAKEGRDP